MDNNLPVIDLSNFETRKHEIAKQIQFACSNIGFFFVVNHGIEHDMIEEIFNNGKELFALPNETKETIAWDSTTNAGYVRLGREKLDPKLPGDVKESFNITANQSFSHNKWNPNLQLQLEKNHKKYFGLFTKVALNILRTYALALDLPEDYFQPSHDILANTDRISGTTMRILHYPKIKTEEILLPNQTRAGAHSDYGSITLLLQYKVGGLEVLGKDGTWFSVPPIEDAIVVNTADLMQRWTNDKFCSTVHRVSIGIDSTLSDRYSCAFFLHPFDDYIVDSLPNAINSKYPPVSAGDYLVERIKSTY